MTELKNVLFIKAVDKKHQLKGDYLVVKGNTVSIKDPYEGTIGY